MLDRNTLCFQKWSNEANHLVFSKLFLSRKKKIITCTLWKLVSSQFWWQWSISDLKLVFPQYRHHICWAIESMALFEQALNTTGTDPSEIPSQRLPVVCTFLEYQILKCRHSFEVDLLLLKQFVNNKL